MNIANVSLLAARRCLGLRQLRSVVLLLVLLLSLLPLRSAVAAPGDLDDKFLDPNPTGGAPTDPGFYVGSLVEQPEGKIVVAGHFFVMNGEGRDRLARFYSDGSLDKSFAEHFSIENSIFSLTQLRNGDLIAAGSLIYHGSKTISCLVRLNASDGAVELSFATQFDPLYPCSVSAVVELPDGDLLIGGSFTSINGKSRPNIARLNADGSLDESFMDNALGTQTSGPNGRVHAVAVQQDGKILIGGSFTSVNGVPRSNIARLETNGTLDASFLNTGTGPNYDVYTITLQPDGKALIGGAFYEYNHQQGQYIARLTTTGSLDPNFMAGQIGPDGQVRSITLLPDGKLLISGYFDTYFFTALSGVNRGGIARLNADGTLDTTFMGDQEGADEGILRALVLTSGKILVGGNFKHINGVSRNLIARLNSTGSIDPDFMMAGANNEVTAVEVQPSDGKVLVGGSFTTMNELPQPGIARLNSDGSTDIGFSSYMSGVSGNNGRVDAIALQTDGKILLGGSFNTAGIHNANNLVRLNPNGSVDTTFEVSGTRGTNGPVYDILVQPDGKILIAGDFTYAAGGPRQSITRLVSGYGGLDGTFNPVEVNDTVYSMALQADGKVIIAGDFTVVNGQPRYRVARLNADGTLDTTYLSGVSGANSLVRWVDLDPQGNAVIGGWFTDVNGVSVSRVARLSAVDGTPDANFQKDLGTINNGIRSLQVQPDGAILIGGEFTEVYGQPCPYFARLTASGALASPFTCSEMTSINGGLLWVNDIALQQNADVIIGGNFTHLDGAERGRIARLDGSFNFSQFLPSLRK